jgi:site-specific recombinase XerD
MRAKIDREMLREIYVGIKEKTLIVTKTYDINDTETKGFTVRVTPTGTMSYVLRFTGKDGKQARHALDMTFPSTIVSTARAKTVALIGQIATGHNPAEVKRTKSPTALTLFSFIDDEYGKHLHSKSKTADVTIRRLKSCFEQFKNKPLSEIDLRAIDKWRAKKVKDGLSVTTVNRDIGCLKPLFSQAVLWKILPTNPLTAVKPIKSDADPIVRFLSDDEEIRFRAAIDAREVRDKEGRIRANVWRTARKYDVLPELDDSHFVDHLKPALLLSINTGIRRGELMKLLWTDVSLGKDASLFVRGVSSKSSKGRHVPLNDEAKNTLIQWKAQQGNTRHVFTGHDDQPITDFKTAWGNLLEKAEIENFRWHDMRHHFASRLVMAGVDLNTVRELLGHSDLKMTLRYAHLAPAHKMNAVQLLMRSL